MLRWDDGFGDGEGETRRAVVEKSCMFAVVQNIQDFFTTARRVSPTPSPKPSSHRSKTKGTLRKYPVKCSPRQSRTTIRTKPKSSVKKRLRWTRSSVRNESSDSSSSDTKSSERRPKKPKPPPEWDSSSSSDTEGHVRTEKPKHLIKPPKYNGTTSFETFLVQFQNCSISLIR